MKYIQCIFLILIFVFACSQIQPEKSFYKISDLRTDVMKLTSQGDNHIFYQEPNGFNADSSKFIFKSTRNRKDGLYVIDLKSGEIKLLSNSFGHIPTWSNDGTEIFYGQHGKITAVDAHTLTTRDLQIPEQSWNTFLHIRENQILFVEEATDGTDFHLGLSTINTDGSNYKRLFTTDHQTVFYIDHSTFIDNRILFLTRGKNRDFAGDYNKPYILESDGRMSRLPVQCSHYDVHPNGDKILCASEGYIIDLNGTILKELSLKGHGVWAESDTFLMTGDPIPVPDGPHFGKIALMNLNSNETINLVSHESTYNSSLEQHIQPNAQFSPDGKYTIYKSDNGELHDSDLYLVEVPDSFNMSK